MSLETRYDLLESVPDFRSDGTVRGRERFSSRPVIIHLLGGGSSEENNSLFRLVDRLSEADRAHIFETGTYIGIACAITDELPDGETFRSWLKHAGAGKPTAPQKAEPPGEFTLFLKGLGEGRSAGEVANPAPAPPTNAPGEFTRFLQQASGTPAQDKASVAASIPPADRSSEAPKPGEFTMFLNSLKNQPPQPQPPPLPVASSPDVRKPGRDEYTVPDRSVVPKPATRSQSDIPTRVYDAPTTPVPLATPPQAGEFTRFLKESPAAAARPEIPTPAPAEMKRPEPAEAFPKATATPGEFTEWLRGPQAHSKPPKRAEIPGVSSQQEPGEYTRLISGQPYASSQQGGPVLSPPPAPVGSPLPQPVRNRPPQAVDGDDFDRMIASAPPTPLGQPAPMPTAPDAPERTTRRERLVVIGVVACVVLLLTLAIVAVVFLRR